MSDKDSTPLYTAQLYNSIDKLNNIVYIDLFSFVRFFYVKLNMMSYINPDNK